MNSVCHIKMEILITNLNTEYAAVFLISQRPGLEIQVWQSSAYRQYLNYGNESKKKYIEKRVQN